MEFQVFSVTVEDRYPRAPPEGFSRDDLLEDGFWDVDGIRYVDKEVDGCVAFVFGRAEDGRTVCLRVEGVRPKLYFEMDAPIDVVRRDLQAEISRGTLRVEPRVMCHYHGYEADASAPSGRLRHSYVEASYSSLAAWREAVRANRLRELRKVRTKICELRAEADGAHAAMHTARQGGAAAAADDAAGGDPRTAAERYRAAKERAAHIEDRVVPGLVKLEASLCSGDDNPDPPCGARNARYAHEHFVHPVVRFLHEAGVRPGAWLRAARAHEARLRVSTCDVELIAISFEGLTALLDRDLAAPFVKLDFDIESMGLDWSVDAVIQVSMHFTTHGRPAASETHVVALGTVDGSRVPAGVVVHECATEADVLRTVRRLVVAKDPDFVNAYNGVNFDNRFLFERSRRGCALPHADVDEFLYLSRFAVQPARLLELRLQSGGMGDNLIRHFQMHGRCTLDLYVKLSQDYRSESSYKLDHFLKKLCPHARKEDMDYSQIPVLQRGTPADRARLLSYCANDSVVLDELSQAVNYVVGVLQSARVFGVPPEWVNFRGQQVRFVAQLLPVARGCEAVPVLINRPPFDGTGVRSFQGATVNDPQSGFYTQGVATLDWASLYPNTMLCNNLCPSTLVIDPSALDDASDVVAHRVSDEWTTHFVGARRQRGILPRILDGLLNERAVARKALKEAVLTAKDAEVSAAERARAEERARTLEARQKAFKVSANSVYGIQGASEVGACPCMAVSATTTAFGRWVMEVLKRILPERFPGIRIIYGDTDSVMVVFEGADDVDACAALSREASQFVTDHFLTVLGYHQYLSPEEEARGAPRTPVMILEDEKVYLPYLLLKKKRYAGLKFDRAADGTMVCKGVDCSGLATERSDTLPFVKDILQSALDILMHKRDAQLAKRDFEERMLDLIEDRIPFERFVLCKRLSSKVAGKTDTNAHARVNAARAARDPGSEAALNEQVRFVYVNGHKKLRCTFLAMDPEYALADGHKINRLYYFDHCIADHVRDIFRHLDGVDITDVCARVRSALDRERLGVSSVLRDMLVPRAADAEGAPSRPSLPPLPPRPPPAQITAKKKPRKK